MTIKIFKNLKEKRKTLGNFWDLRERKMFFYNFSKLESLSLKHVKLEQEGKSR